MYRRQCVQAKRREARRFSNVAAWFEEDEWQTGRVN